MKSLKIFPMFVLLVAMLRLRPYLERVYSPRQKNHGTEGDIVLSIVSVCFVYV
jgi:hypothetical protein